MKKFVCYAFLTLFFNPLGAQKVDAGNGHAIILDENGSVWTVGRNNFGQLGNGTLENSSIPVKVEGLPKIQAISRGYDHSMALDFDGHIWLWGCNNYGQLGIWELNHFNKPILLNHDKKFIAIEGGHWHSVALAEDGSVWSWGHNFYAELGNGNREHSEYPIQVECLPEDSRRKTLKNIVEIACVGYHTLALDDNGKVFTWGSNNFGELGNSENRMEVYASPVQLPKIKSVAAGWHHSVALDENGQIWYWGKDQALKYASKVRQKIMIPKRFESLPEMSKIACGSWHSLALDVNGNVWGWGRNRFGMLGTGDTVSHSLPIQIPNMNNIREIGGGCFQSLAVDVEGNILTCGDNPSGQQGIGSRDRLFNSEKMLLNIDGTLALQDTQHEITAPKITTVDVPWQWLAVGSMLLNLLLLAGIAKRRMANR